MEEDKRIDPANLGEILPKPERLSWDEYFFFVAFTAATRGTCDRLRTATVIVDRDRRVIGMGYNGAVAGTPNCDEVGHLMINSHCERTLHGELNAILSIVDKNRVVGGTAYVIGTPCIRCANALFQLGTRREDGTIVRLARVCCLGVYENSLGKDFIEKNAKELGIEFVTFNEDVIDMKKIRDRIFGIHESKGGILYIQESLKSAKMRAENDRGKI